MYLWKELNLNKKKEHPWQDANIKKRIKYIESPESLSERKGNERLAKKGKKEAYSNWFVKLYILENYSWDKVNF